MRLILIIKNVRRYPPPLSVLCLIWNFFSAYLCVPLRLCGKCARTTCFTAETQRNAEIRRENKPPPLSVLPVASICYLCAALVQCRRYLILCSSSYRESAGTAETKWQCRIYFQRCVVDCLPTFGTVAVGS